MNVADRWAAEQALELAADGIARTDLASTTVVGVAGAQGTHALGNLKARTHWRAPTLT
jgi:hypothetical protein